MSVEGENRPDATRRGPDVLFLLNDAVFDIDETDMLSAAEARRFERLGFDAVIELGCELFSEDPLVHRNDPARARRLAVLIASRQPGLNAALFIAPEVRCVPDVVEPRFAVLPELVLERLEAKSRKGALTPVAADKAVWGRLAA